MKIFIITHANNKICEMEDRTKQKKNNYKILFPLFLLLKRIYKL